MRETMTMTGSKGKKSMKGLLAGGIASAAAAVVTLIARVLVSAEMKGIADSHAMIVQVGSEQMSKADYLKYAAGLVTNCTVAGVVLLVLAAVLLVCWYKKKN